MKVLVGYSSYRGKVRKLNEDAYCILLPPSITPEIDALLAIADGMGGHQAGEVASRFVMDGLEQLFSSSAYRQLVDYSPQREDYYAAVLKEVLEHINERLYAQAFTRESLKGMGTTATVALLVGERLFIGHVGDSRAYLIQDGKMQRLTKDHSWVMEQVQAGKMTIREAESHPKKNILTRSLGNRLVVRVDRSIHPIHPKDVLILCTDGLTNVISDAGIQKVVQRNQDPQKACNFLVDWANRRGGLDNITVLIAQFTNEVSKQRRAKRRREVEEGRKTLKLPRHRPGEKSRGEKLIKAMILVLLLSAFVGIWGFLSLLLAGKIEATWARIAKEYLEITLAVAMLIGLGIGIAMEKVLRK